MIPSLIGSSPSRCCGPAHRSPPGYGSRFLVEARALARLNHPRIAPVFEVDCSADSCFIAMGLVEGQSLAEFCGREHRLIGARRAVEIIVELAEILAYSHQRGIVHRDVKPSNIRLDQAGQVHLMDFGIATRCDGDMARAEESKWSGTPAYVAPELARGNSHLLSPASDQYSLGVVFYELLCGRTPFSGPPLYVLYQAANQDPPSPRVFEPGVPPDLAETCLKMLSRSPEGRYGSCEELAMTLRSRMKDARRQPRGRACLSYSRERIA